MTRIKVPQTVCIEPAVKLGDTIDNSRLFLSQRLVRLCVQRQPDLPAAF